MENEFRQLAAVNRALGDETRLRILNMLVERGETCVCEVIETLGTTQSNISFHLTVLKNARLITDKKIGKWMFYRINLDATNRQIASLSELFNGKRLSAARPVANIFALCCGQGAMPLSRKHAKQAVKRLTVTKKAKRTRSRINKWHRA